MLKKKKKKLVKVNIYVVDNYNIFPQFFKFGLNFLDEPVNPAFRARKATKQL